MVIATIIIALVHPTSGLAESLILANAWKACRVLALSVTKGAKVMAGELTPVCNTPLHDKIAMATPCQYVRKTTAFTQRNLETGLMGANSYLVP